MDIICFNRNMVIYPIFRKANIPTRSSHIAPCYNYPAVNTSLGKCPVLCTWTCNSHGRGSLFFIFQVTELLYLIDDRKEFNTLHKNKKKTRGPLFLCLNALYKILFKVVKMLSNQLHLVTDFHCHYSSLHRSLASFLTLLFFRIWYLTWSQKNHRLCQNIPNNYFIDFCCIFRCIFARRVFGHHDWYRQN